MRSSNIITITGAGSARTPALIGSLVKLKDRFPLKKIIFYDIDDERTSKMEDYIRLVLKSYSPETEVIFTIDKDVAYEKTDFVFCQMRAGKNEMRSFDEKIPLKYGLVGQETCGPGGFAYGMRSIDAMIQMVKDVRKHSKDTWILNYTNPAAIVALALDKVFPDDDRILNLCDQPYSLMRSYAKILGVPQEELRATYFGLNHFGWFTDIRDINGENYFDKLRTYLRDSDFKPYNAEQRSKSWLDTYLRVNKYMKFFDEYIPNTYLQYYFFPDEIVEESDPNYTRADEAKDSREKEIWDICSKAKDAKSIDEIEIITDSVFGNLMVELAESIAYDLHNEFILMKRNNNIITNFNKDAIVEVSGTVGKAGANPYKYGEIKPFYKGLMETQYAYEILTVEACLEKNYTKALQALTLNRTIVNPEKAKLVLDDLMEVNKDYWYLK